jgi:hypothetical protein
LSLFIFPYLSALSQVIVVLVIIKNRDRLDFEMRILAAYFVLALIVDVTQVFLAINGISNLWTSHYFFPIQYALLTLVFYYWNRHSSLEKFMLYSIPLVIAAWSLGTIWLGNLAKTLTYVEPASAIFLVLASSYTLIRSDRLEGSSVLDMPAFWVSSATIIFFGGTVVLTSLSTAFLKSSLETMRLAWSTQSIANILANILYAGGFLCLRRKT